MLILCARYGTICVTYFVYCRLPGSNNAYHYGKGYLDFETTFANIRLMAKVFI